MTVEAVPVADEMDNDAQSEQTDMETVAEEATTRVDTPPSKAMDPKIAQLHAELAQERAKVRRMDEANKAQMAAIAAALGITTENEDPQAVAAQATAELRSLKMSIAVRDAIPQGIDAELLTDSVAFNKGLENLTEAEVPAYVAAFISTRKIGKSAEAASVASSRPKAPTAQPSPAKPIGADLLGEAPTPELAALWAGI